MKDKSENTSKNKDNNQSVDKDKNNAQENNTNSPSFDRPPLSLSSSNNESSPTNFSQIENPEYVENEEKEPEFEFRRDSLDINTLTSSQKKDASASTLSQEKAPRKSSWSPNVFNESEEDNGEVEENEYSEYSSTSNNDKTPAVINPNLSKLTTQDRRVSFSQEVPKNQPNEIQKAKIQEFGKTLTSKLEKAKTILPANNSVGNYDYSQDSSSDNNNASNNEILRERRFSMTPANSAANSDASEVETNHKNKSHEKKIQFPKPSKLHSNKTKSQKNVEHVEPPKKSSLAPSDLLNPSNLESKRYGVDVTSNGKGLTLYAVNNPSNQGTKEFWYKNHEYDDGADYFVSTVGNPVHDKYYH